MHKKIATAPVERLSVGAEEAAQILGVGRSTVFKLVKDGTLQGVKLGKRRLFTIHELEALLATLQKGA